MNGYRITAESVRRAFLCSGKRHLILTGDRKTGKSTLLGSLIADGIPGIVTWAVPGKGVYLKDILTGDTAQIGVFDGGIPGSQRKMRPVLSGFHSLGIPLIEKAVRYDKPWAALDEIGYLESACPEYCAAVRELFERKQVMAAVRKNGSDFTEEILRRSDCFVVDLDDPLGKTGCVIMASGLGKRFGGNKLMADFMGKPLLRWVLDSTDGLFSRRIVVTRHRDAADLCERLGIPVCLHDLPERSDTVRLGLQEIGADTDACMFCQGDQPLLSRETMAGMLLCGKADNRFMYRAVYADTAGAPVLFPKLMYESLMTLPSGKGGGFLLKRFPELVRMYPVKNPTELMDIDTPGDLEYLQFQIFT